MGLRIVNLVACISGSLLILVGAAIFASTGVGAQTPYPIQGFRMSKPQLPSEPQNRVFLKNNSKISELESQSVIEDDKLIESSNDQNSERTERERASVTSTAGILSIVFPFGTSATTGSEQTFLRLINQESFSNEITIDVYSIDSFSIGSENQLVFEGSCFISVPGKSAPQLGSYYFEDCIGWTPTSSQEIMVLQFDTGKYLHWQNVIWSPITGYFGNLSTCREPTVSDYFAHSVHTTKISGYPSALLGFIHVFEDYHLDVNIYDAGNGDLIGEFRSQLFPKRINILAMRILALEQSATWFIPLEDLPFQINLEFNLVNQHGVALQEGIADLVSHYVQQTANGETYNMLNTCLY